MTFDEAFHELLGHEGGYSDHPHDPGGKTMWGVTEKVARAHGYRGPMNELPVSFAKSLYKEIYWDSVRADEVPRQARYALFDAAVNSGPVQAIKWLQKAAEVADDGKFGPATLRAVQAYDPELLESRMLGFRLMFMTELGNWKSFNKGWARRVAQVLIDK